MTSYAFSPAAQADLSDYSARNWGLDQADDYIRAIEDACVMLTSGMKQGRRIDDVRPGYWKLPVKSHFLFCRVSDKGLINIVRILHQRMDVTARLRE